METLDEKNSGGMSEQAFQDLKATAGWLKIVAMVSMGILGIMTLFMLYALTKGASQVIIPIAIYAFLIFLNFLLLKQGNALAAFGNSKNSGDLDEFSKNFKTYWMIYGILAILAAVLFLFGMLLGGSALMNGRMF